VGAKNPRVLSPPQATTLPHVDQPHQFDVTQLSLNLAVLSAIEGNSCAQISRSFSQTDEAQCTRYYVHVHAQSISRMILRVVYMTVDFSVGTTPDNALFRLADSFYSILLTT
jgi:hypothetical protein